MRVLHAASRRLRIHRGEPYAILSHTWGEDGNEVLFEHLKDPTAPLPKHLPGWAKVQYACDQALEGGLEFVWIDTCCIDKSSSAELSEAINSMWAWYGRSAICYAYLADVEREEPNTDGSLADWAASRWFTRGWTLQELIASPDLCFYDRQWNFLGEKYSRPGGLGLRVSIRTKIPLEVLDWANGGHDLQRLTQVLSRYCVAERLSWAASRETTRVEDRAYSLLGLFGVHMPLLYGEGREAFNRLQHEILRQYNDQSLLAFEGRNRSGLWSSVLADSPDDFINSDIVGTFKIGVLNMASDIIIDPKWLEIGVTLLQSATESSRYVAILPCAFASDLASRPVICLEGLSGNAIAVEGKPAPQYFIRIASHRIEKVSLCALQSSAQVFFLGQIYPTTSLTSRRIRILIKHPTLEEHHMFSSHHQYLVPSTALRLSRHCTLLAVSPEEVGRQQCLGDSPALPYILFYIPAHMLKDFQPEHGAPVTYGIALIASTPADRRSPQLARSYVLLWGLHSIILPVPQQTILRPFCFITPLWKSRMSEFFVDEQTLSPPSVMPKDSSIRILPQIIAQANSLGFEQTTGWSKPLLPRTDCRAGWNSAEQSTTYLKATIAANSVLNQPVLTLDITLWPLDGSDTAQSLDSNDLHWPLRGPPAGELALDSEKASSICAYPSSVNTDDMVCDNLHDDET